VGQTAPVTPTEAPRRVRSLRTRRGSVEDRLVNLASAPKKPEPMHIGRLLADLAAIFCRRFGLTPTARRAMSISTTATGGPRQQGRPSPCFTARCPPHAPRSTNPSSPACPRAPRTSAAPGSCETRGIHGSTVLHRAVVGLVIVRRVAAASASLITQGPDHRTSTGSPRPRRDEQAEERRRGWRCETSVRRPHAVVGPNR
jgi:hypothetical protein